MHFLQNSSTKLAEIFCMNSLICNSSPCKSSQTGVFGVKIVAQGRGIVLVKLSSVSLSFFRAMEDLTDSDRMWLKKIEDHKPNLLDLSENDRLWLKKMEETLKKGEILYQAWKLMKRSAEKEFRLLLKLLPVELVTSPLYLK